MSLVVREFVKFPVENELRGFVCKGVFTALTQYNNLVGFQITLLNPALVHLNL